ncbi:MAG: gliding motility-associated C-terminal domain-containing protein, partial [Chitinophagales bacterium]
LVAYNGNCTDTAVAYYFFPGFYPSATSNARRVYGFPSREHMVEGIYSTADGGYLINGRREESSFFQELKQGLIFKSKPTGCVEWGRRLIGPFYNTDITVAKEAADGNIYMLASMLQGSQYLVKLDANGNLVWSKSLKDAAGNYQYLSNIEPTADGGVVAVSYPEAFTSLNITRFDASGGITWQKKQDYNGNYAGDYRRLFVKDGYLYLTGGLSNGITTESYISKFDFSNGQSIWMKKYSATPYLGISDMTSIDSTITVAITGSTGDITRTVIGGIMRLDTAGNIIQSNFICESYTPNGLFGPFIGGPRLTKSGKNLYIISPGFYPLTLQGDGTNSKIIRLDSNYQVRWTKGWGGIGSPRYYYHSPGANEGIRIAGIEFGYGTSATIQSRMINMWPIDSAGGNLNENCFFPTQDFVVLPAPVTAGPVQWTLDAAGTNISENRPIEVYDFYPEMRFRCPEYVDSCSFIKVTGPRSVCNLSYTYTYNSHRNKACGQPTQWETSPGIQVIGQTDSSITVRFLNFGRYVVYGKNLQNCVPTQDSIVIIAASITPPLNLGNDHEICVNNSDTLRAGHRFMTYLWQNGTTDSTLVINQPGQYWVEVKDSCDNVLRDTVNISLAAPIPFSIGNDRVICQNDTIHINATPGFMNYQWKPAYQLNSTTAQQVVATPLVDTSYSVKTEKTPGCFAYDTMRVTVHTSPSINLGIDQSFCMGDSLVLDAGLGFQTYAWSTGASIQQIIVKTAGEYSIMGTTINGCKSRDTLSVQQVFALPDPQLTKDPILCEGSSTPLRAASGFVSYQWNTGATTPVINVQDIGSYSVNVEDSHGCFSADTVIIAVKQPLPSGFLATEILYCEYETPVLQPTQSFHQYLWSTGATTPSIKVNSPADYWLQVDDNNGCIGRDTVIVKLKTGCIVGVFVPTAFTPDNNGRNDFFFPLVYGVLEQYDFKVFNRWGAIIFQSKTPGRGWDGRAGGVPQDANVFVWTLQYKLENQPVKAERGTVMLVR